MKGADVPLDKPIIGVVLAGGASSRMGRDKALLPYKGRHLIDYVIQQHTQAGARTVYVSGALGGYPHIPDQWQGKGPVAGICSVILALEANVSARVVISSVDCPYLTASSLVKLASSKAKICYFEGAALPFAIDVNEAVLSFIRQEIVPYFASGSASVRHFLESLKAVPIPPTAEDCSSLINTNTPEEWEAVQNEYTL